MPRKLSDHEVASLRALAGEGLPAAELAERFGVSRRHVGRLLRGEQRQQIAGLDREVARESVGAAVERFIAGLELEHAGQVLASAAFVLASKLDAARASDTAAAGAAPALARQLVEVVYALRPDGEAPDAVDDLRRRREARLLARHVDPDAFTSDSKRTPRATSRRARARMGGERVSTRLEEAGGLLVALVAAGLSLPDACTQAEVPLDTVKTWLKRGRREDEGPYAELSAAIDAARTSEAPLGPMSEEELALVVSRAARKGSVQAMKLRSQQLSEVKRPRGSGDIFDTIDELAARRARERKGA